MVHKPRVRKKPMGKVRIGTYGNTLVLTEAQYDSLQNPPIKRTGWTNRSTGIKYVTVNDRRERQGTFKDRKKEKPGK